MVAEVRYGKMASTIRASLQRVAEQPPFPITGIKMDGGNEFKAEFETHCQERAIRLFVLPRALPNSMAWSNAHSGSTATRSMLAPISSPSWNPCKAALRTCEDSCNTVRPHRALDYLIPYG
jgi:hypothetical protein